MLWIGLALSLSGAIGDGKSLILQPAGEQVRVMAVEAVESASDEAQVAETGVGVPKVQVAETGIGVPKVRVAETGVGVPKVRVAETGVGVPKVRVAETGVGVPSSSLVA